MKPGRVLRRKCHFLTFSGPDTGSVFGLFGKHGKDFDKNRSKSVNLHFLTHFSILYVILDQFFPFLTFSRFQTENPTF